MLQKSVRYIGSQSSHSRPDVDNKHDDTRHAHNSHVLLAEKTMTTPIDLKPASKTFPPGFELQSKIVTEARTCTEGHWPSVKWVTTVPAALHDSGTCKLNYIKNVSRFATQLPNLCNLSTNWHFSTFFRLRPYIRSLQQYLQHIYFTCIYHVTHDN